uniref:RNase H type-1 domain-containing protein n=1 Tax=Brassica oleracea var. oleracea TaxID=109376 RepID=A0A0D3D715_BRAOL
MGHGHPQLSSVDVDGYGWTTLEMLMGTQNHVRRESPLHSEVEALRWAMENMLQHSTCQSFGTDCKELIDMIKEPRAWSSFAT